MIETQPQPQERESWSSQLGFMLASAGSAVGLANIWRFPYIVGQNGGAAFILVYLFCLLLVGLPVFFTEVAIGRNAQSSPYGAFKKLGRTTPWAWTGTSLVIVGFVVSAFYSVIAGWIMGYFVEALRGSLIGMYSPAETQTHYQSLISSPIWTVGWHAVFLFTSVWIVYTGVQKGIERSSRWMMPLLLLILLGLVFRGFTTDKAAQGLHFLFSPDWSMLTPQAILIALGHAFFTLSLGQGTMITYGSYLPRSGSILRSCTSVACIDTLIALLSGMAIFTFLFSADLEPTAGPGLLFQAMPLVFAQMPGGYLLSVAFFFLVFLAALSSEISAIEPLVAYLIDEKGYSRRKAVILCGSGAFLIGIPCALSTNVLASITIYGSTFNDILTFTILNICIPLGGAAAVLLGAWRWGIEPLLVEIGKNDQELLNKYPWIAYYLRFCLKYVTPILIIIILLHASEII